MGREKATGSITTRWECVEATTTEKRTIQNRVDDGGFALWFVSARRKLTATKRKCALVAEPTTTTARQERKGKERGHKCAGEKVGAAAAAAAKKERWWMEWGKVVLRMKHDHAQT